MIEGMAEARKLIKNMQQCSSKIQGIVEEANLKNQYQKNRPPLVLFAGDIDRSKLVEIKESFDEEETKQIENANRTAQEPPFDVTIAASSILSQRVGVEEPKESLPNRSSDEANKSRM